jgi:cysteine desulfurase/selenocysteine lyase
MANLEAIRAHFPQLETQVNGKKLIYLDNAATTLKPKAVIEEMNQYLTSNVANVHRGVHTLSETGTRHFEETREALKVFINAQHSHEVIYTKGTTDSVNLLAHSFGEAYVSPGDEIIISHMEHHSNIVPWQMLAERKKALLKIIPISQVGEINLEDYKKLLTSKTKLVSIVHTSNTLGTINPVKEMARLAHAVGAHFAIDAAQSIAHQKIDVQDLDCDYLYFSAHKLYGPNGVGVLYGKEKYLNEMPPYQGGGAMISEVTFEKTTYNVLPNKFEAGTPVIAEVIAFKKALDFVNEVGFEFIAKQENHLLELATNELTKIKGLKILGTSKNKSSVISFVIQGIHPHDLGTILDKQGIAIRTGHHCTQPLLKFFNISACARASFSFYNNDNDVNALVKGIEKAVDFLS